MSDRYTRLVNTGVGKFVAGNVGLPQPVVLERYEPGRPVIKGTVLLGGSGGSLAAAAVRVLASAEASVDTTDDADVRSAAADAGLDAGHFNADTAADERFKALVFDASGIKDSTELGALREFFAPTIRRVESCGRVIVLGRPPESCETPREATAQRALEGFARAVGKEVRRGSTSQLVYVDDGGEAVIDSTLRFLLSPRSAYVSGQVIRVGSVDHGFDVIWENPLAGKVALVTGASRGIGEQVARTLARDGAHVVGLDIPPLKDDMDAVASSIGGSALALDITADGAPKEIADHLAGVHGGVDIVVHNAGVTRDKTLGRMTEELWEGLLDINLSSEERINDELIARDLIRENGRVVCTSSISGIAGNAGQTNYSTSKAGVIGMVQSMAPMFAERKVTINAVAPGFIETQMTAAMPIGTREAGRRLNSMSQGGLPIDVAETIAWFASPGSGGVNGNIVRVCGQSLIGA